MLELLKKLNRRSPFTWEIRTDGFSYGIYCENMDVYNSEGETLEGLDEQTCLEWLGKFCDEV